MIYALAVHGAPYASTANHHALRFAEALVQAGHTICRVFFYHEGVMSGLVSQVPPQGEENLLEQWQSLAAQHQIELAICIANGLKRGILSDQERNRYEQSAATLAAPFELVGLGQLVAAIAEADRYVEFPA